MRNCLKDAWHIDEFERRSMWRMCMREDGFGSMTLEDTHYAEDFHWARYRVVQQITVIVMFRLQASHPHINPDM